jgi:hypothetical protein
MAVIPKNQDLPQRPKGQKAVNNLPDAPLSLPASKQEVVRHLRSKSANADEITVIERLPEQEFTTMADILQGIGQVDAPG